MFKIHLYPLMYIVDVDSEPVSLLCEGWWESPGLMRRGPARVETIIYLAHCELVSTAGRCPGARQTSEERGWFIQAMLHSQHVYTCVCCCPLWSGLHNASWSTPIRLLSHVLQSLMCWMWRDVSPGHSDDGGSEFRAGARQCPVGDRHWPDNQLDQEKTEAWG